MVKSTGLLISVGTSPVVYASYGVMGLQNNLLTCNFNSFLSSSSRRNALKWVCSLSGYNEDASPLQGDICPVSRLAAKVTLATFLSFVGRDVLSSEPLVQDVQHLPTEVDEEQRQSPWRHDGTQTAECLQITQAASGCS